MKQLKDIANVTLLDKKRAEKEIKKPSYEQAHAHVDRLFENFSNLFLYSRTLYEDQDHFENVKFLWAQTFFDEGITGHMIKHGLRLTKLADSGFMPTLGQFIARCHDADPNLPSPYQVLADIVKNAHPSITDPDWCHPLARRVCQLIGSHEASHMSFEKLEKAVEKAYAIAARESAYEELRQSCDLMRT